MIFNSSKKGGGSERPSQNKQSATKMKKLNPTALRLCQSGGGKVYIETYGCQMNTLDGEIVISIMESAGYTHTNDIDKADVILINTCAIRDNAETRIWGRLRELRQYKRKRGWLIVGLIGCMAERLKAQVLEREKVVDMVIGPDSYRMMGELVARAASGLEAIDVQLSQEETYSEIKPVRLDQNGVSAYVSIMRGCNNMCSYCVVPYTRGAERSRADDTILDEVRELLQSGYREVTLLGQNVNSYRYGAVTFAELLARVAGVSPLLRVRFSTSHPKDLSDEVITVMAAHANICKAIHLPAQSGSSRMLELMNRHYDRPWYLDRIQAIRRAMPDCGISTDVIAGFCGETEQDHQQTLSLMQEVGYDFSYMFKYSERPNTKAQRTLQDDVPETEKVRRLTEIIKLQGKLSLISNRHDLGRIFEVLIEGKSKRSDDQLVGRTSQNKVAVFSAPNHKVGDYVRVKVVDCSSATLKCELLEQ